MEVCALIINEIHIYGYGKLENFQVGNLADLTIFFGENEAGKSTIMSFIHSVLFGFPTKQQSELRYEPKNLAKYGGRLMVTFASGKAVIERVKGKATGDVNVRLEDGRIGGEELLKELLSNMDKSLFQSIFSFNLHGLQNVQQMKNEDLGKFLFSTGTLGTDRLLMTETTLQKHLDSVYKPNGKKPYLNEKILELKSLHQELKRAEQHNDQYWQYLNEKDSLEERITNVHNESLQQQSQFSKLQEWKRVLPTIREKQGLKKEFSQVADCEFPIDGLTRFEEVKRQLNLCVNKITILATRINELEQEIKNSATNSKLLENELAIFTAVENLPLYEQLKQESNQINLTLKEINDEIFGLQQKLHLPIDESRVLASNTSVFMKEKAVDAGMKEKRLKEKKRELDEQFQQTKQELEEFEVRINQLRESFLSETRRADLIEQKGLAENRMNHERELKEVREQIRKLTNLQQQEAKQEKVQQKQSLFQLVVLSSIFVLLAVWSFIGQQWGILAVAIAGLLYSIIFRKKKVVAKTNDLQNEITELSTKEKALASKLNHSSFQDALNITQQLEEDQRLREHHGIVKIKWEQKNEQYEKILMTYEKWEQESHFHHKYLIDLGKGLGIPKDIALTFIQEAFLLIEKLKTAYLEKKKITERQRLLQSELVQIESRIQNLASQFLPNEAFHIHNSAYLLKQELKKHQERQIYNQENSKKLLDLQEEHKQYRLEMEQLTQEKTQLFQHALVESEADFRQKAEACDRRGWVVQRLKEIERQLAISALSEADQMELQAIGDPEQRLNRLQIEQGDTQKLLMDLQDQIAKVKYQIELLEDGGTYAELLHLYKLKQSELNEEAKEWSKYAIAKDLLSKAVEQYKEQRLPKMIEHAENFLRYLTDDHYIRIHTQKEGNGFLIESHDHILFEPNELSQATSEQIYVSLRLALATTLYEKYQFPIIIDDSFVNFDQNRTKKVIKLLSELTGHQILFFTCHQHLLEFFQKGKVIDMGSNIPNPVQL